MERAIRTYLIIIIVSLFALFILLVNFLNFTGNVLLDTGNFNSGGQLSGVLVLDIEEGDSLSKELLVFLALSRNDSVIVSESFTLEKFIENSNSKILFVERGSGEFYDTPGTYELEVSKVINYTFEEPGNYELLFSILDLDMNTRKKFRVK